MKKIWQQSTDTSSVQMQGLLLAAILIILLLCGCSINGQNVIPGEITGRVYLDEDADSQCDECGCDFFLEG